MTTKRLPPPELLRQLLRYEPETGELFWRERDPSLFKKEKDCSAWNKKYAGTKAFKSTVLGYKSGNIFNTPYKAHRIAWCIYYGEDPKLPLDHINGNAADNRIRNLRKASPQENMQNRKLQSNNRSGVLGVCWCEPMAKWKAYIKSQKANIHLGYFEDLGDAVSARKAAEVKYGFHPNHGKR